MKRIDLWYWIVTLLFAAAMIFSAIPDALSVPDAVALVVDQMGYPAYVLPYVGIAKIIGVIVILVPGYPRLKEWAYAGLFFDLLAATYSVIAIGTPVLNTLPMLVFFALLFGSYALYHRRLRARIATGMHAG